jgi:excisionase family DNA binding protein
MIRSAATTYTVPEAARAMRCSLKWVNDMVRVGRISAEKIAGRWYIPKAEIEARRRKQGQR